MPFDHPQQLTGEKGLKVRIRGNMEHMLRSIHNRNEDQTSDGFLALGSQGMQIHLELKFCIGHVRGTNTLEPVVSQGGRLHFFDHIMVTFLGKPIHAATDDHFPVPPQHAMPNGHFGGESLIGACAVALVHLVGGHTRSHTMAASEANGHVEVATGRTCIDHIVDRQFHHPFSIVESKHRLTQVRT